MRKTFLRYAAMMTTVAMATTVASCSDSDNEAPAPEPPTINVSITDVQRTQADFTIQSTGAADYAYVIVESDPEYVAPTAEALFEEGTTGTLEDGTANITTYDIEGEKEYDLYVATRKINPYVYSEVEKYALNTNIAYDGIVTMNRIGQTDFTYHVEKPAGVETMKHIAVKTIDYEAIKSMLALYGEVSYELYLKVFGIKITESQDITLDKYSQTSYADDIDIHQGAKYLVMAGAVTESGEIDPEKFQCIEIQTRPAIESPFRLEASVKTTSTKVTVNVVPDPEIVEYRVLIDKKSEFDYWKRESEEQVHSEIIGHWDDEKNFIKRLYTGNSEIEKTGLVPNTDYVVGIVGFDAERREYMTLLDCRTSEPTGPAPTITITANSDVATPWNSASYTVKVKDAATVRFGYFLKSQVDDVLANGSSMSAIIENNGTYADEEQFAAMNTAEGLTLDAEQLQPETEYIFGVWAASEELVSSCEYSTFTTGVLPQLGGEVRKNMPGKYTASTTDADGNTVTFPVTITTGVDDATTDAYSKANRLVALGFGPADQFVYKSPADMIAAGKTAEEAAELYGPKWFIEFRDNEIVVPDINDLEWTMGNPDGTENNYYMWGYGFNPNSGRDMDNHKDFPVEVSEDGNTITVKGSYNEWVEMYYYPTMVQSSNSWLPSDIAFRCYSELVLTRQQTKSAAYVHKSAITMPKRFVINASDSSVKDMRAACAERMRK